MNYPSCSKAPTNSLDYTHYRNEDCNKDTWLAAHKAETYGKETMRKPSALLLASASIPMGVW